MVGDNVVLSPSGLGVPWIAVERKRVLEKPSRVSKLQVRIEMYVPVARQKKPDALFDDRGKLGLFAKRAKNEPVVK